MELITGYSGLQHIQGGDIAKINSSVYTGENVILENSISYSLDVKKGEISFTGGVALFSGRMVIINHLDSVSVTFPDSSTLFKKILVGIHYHLDSVTQVETCQLKVFEGDICTTSAAAKSSTVQTYGSTIDTATTDAFMLLWEIIISGESQIAATRKYLLFKSLSSTQADHSDDVESLRSEISSLSSDLSEETSTRSNSDSDLNESISALSDKCDDIVTSIGKMKLKKLRTTLSSGLYHFESGHSMYLLILQYRSRLISMFVREPTYVSTTDIYNLPSVFTADKIYNATISVKRNLADETLVSSNTEHCFNKPSSLSSWQIDTTTASVTLLEVYAVQSEAISA